jgi:PPOX class probable F420-dependent enzyme
LDIGHALIKEKPLPTSTPPASHVDLLERPLFAHLATVRPDGAPQTNVMWFEWDGERVRFTHTSARQKYRNLAHEPRVAFSIHDPENPYRFIEVRGQVESIEKDPDAAFYRTLQKRYDQSYEVKDAAVRVVVTVRPTAFVATLAGAARPNAPTR